MRDVRGELTTVMRDVFGIASLEINDEMTAKDVKGWDSLTNIDLVVAVEKHFKIKMTTRDVANLKNVGELIKLVETKAGAS
jgi:acyl carrier protein